MRPLLSLAALCIACPALAADIEASSHIESVTLYPDAAQATRIAEVELPAGASRVVHLHGELVVVIEHRDGKCETFSTDLHRNRENWAGGRVDDADFSNACCLLQQENRDRLFGHLLDESDMETLLSGRIHPLSFVNPRRASEWVNDWWDLDHFGRQGPDHYWEGYGAFCMRTNGDVEANERQKAERAAILAGQWEPGRFREAKKKAGTS